MQSPTAKLHTHGFYLTLVAKHVANPKTADIVPQSERGRVGGHSESLGPLRQEQLLGVVLPALGKDRLGTRKKKEFYNFIESDIAQLDGNQFASVLGRLNDQFSQQQGSHFKAGDFTAVIDRLRTIVKEYQGPPTSKP